MFDFHNPFFCVFYICILFLAVLGAYFKIVFTLTDEDKIIESNFKTIIVFGTGIFFAIVISYLLFEFVRFIQFYY